MLVIDNYDSFVYNLVQYLGELGAEPIVHRHDAVTLDEMDALGPDARARSRPGPGRPADAGLSNDAIRHFGERGVPVLGVCLGQQCIGELYGGTVVRAPHVMHGKTSEIRHTDVGVFAGLPEPDHRDPLPLARRRARDSVPDVLEITAESEDGLVMGLRHREFPIEGVQFHPGVDPHRRRATTCCATSSPAPDAALASRARAGRAAGGAVAPVISARPSRDE